MWMFGERASRCRQIFMHGQSLLHMVISYIAPLPPQNSILKELQYFQSGKRCGSACDQNIMEDKGYQGDQSRGKISYRSAPNIALVKYWGKYHQDEILPINDSLGLTLNADDLTTTTTCSFEQSGSKDRFTLNGQPFPVTSRMANVLYRFRLKARLLPRFQFLSQEEWEKFFFHIESVNSFPTASGMASSASGFSCLAVALNGLFGNVFDEVELSQLARWGSGSAARAVYGGLVRWRGVPDEIQRQKQSITAQELQKLSKYCISFTSRPSSSLSFIKVLVLLTEDKEKQVSSTAGMKRSTETSELLKYRHEIASRRILNIEGLLDKIVNLRKERQEDSKADAKFEEIVTTVDTAEVNKISIADEQQKAVSSNPQKDQNSIKINEIVKESTQNSPAIIQNTSSDKQLIDSKGQEYHLYGQFAKEVIRDSNQFHAICLDTYPPVFYLNSFSRQIIHIVDNIINPNSLKTKVAYSFDAGAHAFLFLHQDMLHEVLAYFQSTFNLTTQQFNSKGVKAFEEASINKESIYPAYDGANIAPTAIWVTDVGRGAQAIPFE